MNIGLNWLPEAAYSYLLIFGRVGTMLMLLPGFGEAMIPSRMRLSFALLFALVLFPLVSSQLPPFENNNLIAAVTVLFHEVAIGFILGGIARLVVSAAQAAGAIIAYQAGLSIAQSADPTQNGIQGALVGSFLSYLGITLIFATNLHHLLLSAVFQSYRLFPPTAPIMLPDAATLAVDTVESAFSLGVQMSAPFIVFGLVFYLGLGILARLMPQVQVFFVAMPANIGLGLVLLLFLLTTMMGWYMMHVEAQFSLLGGI